MLSLHIKSTVRITVTLVIASQHYLLYYQRYIYLENLLDYDILQLLRLGYCIASPLSYKRDWVQ